MPAAAKGRAGRLFQGMLPVRGRLLSARVFGFATLVLCGPAHALELDFGVAMTLEHMSLPVPSPARPIVCHGFGCAYQTPIQLRPTDIAQIRKFLGTAEDAIDERRGMFPRRSAVMDSGVTWNILQSHAR